MRAFSHPGPLLLPVLLAAPLVGCAGSVCDPACEKIYGAGDGECNIQVPGRTNDEDLATCEDACKQAWQQPGEVGDYDPNVRAANNTDVSLENRAQVELWAQCIDETACTDINEGYCAPI